MQVTKRIFQPLLCLMVLLACLIVALPQRAEASTAQIAALPKDVETTAGYTAQFTVEANGVGAYKWQYRRSETAVWVNTTMEGYKTDTLSVPAILARDGYQYRCRITATDGAVLYTEPATLTVNDSIFITAQPTRQIVGVDENAVFTVEADGEGLTYQWQYRKNSDSGWMNTGMSGNTTDALTVPAPLSRNGYQYRCVITDENGIRVCSKAATLSVIGFTSHPADQTMAVGSNAVFTVAAEGQNLTYQWQYRKNSTGSWMTTSLTGAKTDTLTVAATASRNGYQYRCRITDALSVVVYSDAATLTVGSSVPVTTYTVTFKDHDGTVLKTETVESGKAATAPANSPSREGCVFTGWDKRFSSITGDLTVTAVYDDYDIVMKTIVHRGYNKIAPENTMPAFQLAKEYGFKYIEADVNFTSDGVAVMLHDRTIDRTSDGTGTLAEMTYAEVSQYDFGSWKSSVYKGTKIPTFEEFISWCKDNNMHPYIDAKSLGADPVLRLLEIVKKYDMEDKVTWGLGIGKSLRALAAADPDARIAFIVTEVKPAYISLLQEEVFKTNSVLFSSGDYSADAVALCKEANIPMEVWSINDTNIIASLDPYISGVTSDFIHVGKYLYNLSNASEYEVVTELTSDDIRYGYSLATSAKHYLGSSAGTAAYGEFDIAVEEGYYYKFEFISTATTAQIGIVFVSEAGVTRVDSGLGCGQANIFNTGWMTSGVEMDAPANINGSPAKVVRFNFNSNDTGITEDFITSVIVSRRPMA